MGVKKVPESKVEISTQSPDATAARMRTFVEVRSSDERDLGELSRGEQPGREIGDEAVRTVDHRNEQEWLREGGSNLLPRSEERHRIDALHACEGVACGSVCTRRDLGDKGVPDHVTTRRVEEGKRSSRAGLQDLRSLACQGRYSRFEFSDLQRLERSSPVQS